MPCAPPHAGGLGLDSFGYSERDRSQGRRSRLSQPSARTRSVFAHFCLRSYSQQDVVIPCVSLAAKLTGIIFRIHVRINNKLGSAGDLRDFNQGRYFRI